MLGSDAMPDAVQHSDGQGGMQLWLFWSNTVIYWSPPIQMWLPSWSEIIYNSQSVAA